MLKSEKIELSKVNTNYKLLLKHLNVFSKIQETLIVLDKRSIRYGPGLLYSPMCSCAI